MLRLPYANLVRDEAVYAWVQRHMGALFHATRHDRLIQEQRWMHFWKIFNVELDDQGYQGRSRVYLSAGRQTIETWRISLLGGLFPFSEWFDCAALHGAGLQGNAQAEKALQRQQLHKMPLRQELSKALHQYLALGTGVLRQTWVDGPPVLQRFYERVLIGAPADDDTTVLRTEPEAETEDTLRFQQRNGTEVRLVEKRVREHVGPSLRAVDLFHFYLNPTTGCGPQEAQLAFEDMTVALSHLEAVHAEWMDPTRPELGRVYDALDEVLASRGRLPADTQQSEQERKVREGLAIDPNEFEDLAPGFVNLTEAFWRGEIPGATDPDTGEEYGTIDWLLCVVNDQWPIRIQPNPFYKKRRPWRFARFLSVLNESYGRGMVEPFASVQYMLNDLGNLTFDNINNTLCPIALINDDLVSNFESLQFAPQAKWFVDPAGVQFVTPPNVAQIGLATMQLFTGFIQDYGGANFAVQGVPAPRGRGRAQNTASGMAMLQSSGSAGFQSALEDLQDQWMVPILEANYELTEQFMSDRQRIVQLGKDGLPSLERDIGVEDVIGHYVFTWKGAQQVRERMALVNGLQGFIQMAGQIRVADPQAAQAFTIKWGPLMKRFLTDGLGLPWADEVITTPEDARSVDPLLELDLLAAHRDCPIESGDDDQAHLTVQAPALTQEPFLRDPIAKALLTNHVLAHLAQFQQKQQAAEQQMMMQALAAQAGGGRGATNGAPGMASPPGMGGAPAGGMDQLADAARAGGGNGGLTG